LFPGEHGSYWRREFRDYEGGLKISRQVSLRSSRKTFRGFHRSVPANLFSIPMASDVFCLGC
jgi:hypothetical protein